MGIRTRLKRVVKKAIGGGECAARDDTKQTVAPTASAPTAAESTRSGNLRDGEETPWYLKYEDADGWESTNAQEGIDED